MNVALPPRVRAVVYYVIAVAGLGLGATQVGFLAAAKGQPVWLTVALSVFGFFAAGFGTVAASHTPVQRSVQFEEVRYGSDDLRP